MLTRSELVQNNVLENFKKVQWNWWRHLKVDFLIFYLKIEQFYWVLPMLPRICFCVHMLVIPSWSIAENIVWLRDVTLEIQYHQIWWFWSILVPFVTWPISKKCYNFPANWSIGLIFGMGSYIKVTHLPHKWHQNPWGSDVKVARTANFSAYI